MQKCIEFRLSLYNCHHSIVQTDSYFTNTLISMANYRDKKIIYIRQYKHGQNNACHCTQTNGKIHFARIHGGDFARIQNGEFCVILHELS